MLHYTDTAEYYSFMSETCVYMETLYEIVSSQNQSLIKSKGPTLQ